MAEAVGEDFVGTILSYFPRNDRFKPEKSAYSVHKVNNLIDSLLPSKQGSSEKKHTDPNPGPEGPGTSWARESKPRNLPRPRKYSHANLLTTQQAFWHCMTLVLGLGTLTMPYAFKQLGWCAIISLGALAWLSAYTAKLLCICIDYVPSPEAGRGMIQVLDTYPDIGEAAFGPRGRLFVKCILYMDLIASSALFLVFIATNAAELAPAKFSSSTWILISALSLLPTVWLKLRKLTFLSALGSYLMVALVVAVLYSAYSAAPETLENNQYSLANFQVQALGNMIFAFACHGTLLTVYRDMRNPQEAPGLFNRVYASGYALKVLVGCTGYYLFAQDASDQITLDLPIPWLKALITVAVTAKKWLTYALPLEPVALDAESEACRGERSTLIRSLLVATTVVMALFLPYFGLFQSLIGSLCAGFLVLIFPILFYMTLYGKKMSRGSWFFHGVLLLLSVVLVSIASYKSLAEAHELWGAKKHRNSTW